MLLTTKTIDALQAEKHQQIADDGCAGLTLSVLPSGTKSWAFRYRNRAGRQCRVALGFYARENLRDSDRVSLKRAREAADELRAKVRSGTDPVAERQAEREAARQATEAATLEAERIERGDVIGSDTFARVWAAFEKNHFPTLRPGTVTKWKGIYRRVLGPRWKDKPLNEITDADVIAIKQALKKSPDAADSALTLISAFFGWCADDEQKYIAPKDNPVIGIKKVKRPKGKEKANPESDRPLSRDEIRWLWKATEDQTDTFNCMVRLLLLTGARRSEASDMKRNELDLRTREWRVPPDRYKTGLTHTIYLSDAALTVLRSVPKIDKSSYVFAIRGGGPINGFSKRKSRLDARMAEIAATEVGEPVKIRPWRLHGLRKTFRGGLTAWLGVETDIAKRCTGHSIGGMDKIYDQEQYAAQRADAFYRWSDCVLELSQLSHVSHGTLNESVIAPELQHDATADDLTRSEPQA